MNDGADNTEPDYRRRKIMRLKVRKITLAASALLACFCVTASAQEKAPPNVIFILADDLGWRDTATGSNAVTPQGTTPPKRTGKRWVKI